MKERTILRGRSTGTSRGSLFVFNELKKNNFKKKKKERKGGRRILFHRKKGKTYSNTTKK